MKFILLTIGRTTNKHLLHLQEDYKNRIKFYLPFEMITLPEIKNTKKLSVPEIVEKESELISNYLQITDEVILLDEKGEQFTSVGFSEFISKKLLSSKKRIIFVVGGPYGFAKEIYPKANHTIALSSMTFSHEMVRVIFLEQLYRAMTILKGEHYHHA